MLIFRYLAAAAYVMEVASYFGRRGLWRMDDDDDNNE